MPTECTSAATVGTPELSASWFPKGVANTPPVRCGTHLGYTDGSTLYAWQLGADLNAERHAPIPAG